MCQYYLQSVPFHLCDKTASYDSNACYKDKNGEEAVEGV
jgi:hypothetical protein